MEEKRRRRENNFSKQFILLSYKKPLQYYVHMSLVLAFKGYLRNVYGNRVGMVCTNHFQLTFPNKPIQSTQTVVLKYLWRFCSSFCSCSSFISSFIFIPIISSSPSNCVESSRVHRVPLIVTKIFSIIYTHHTGHSRAASTPHLELLDFRTKTKKPLCVNRLLVSGRRVSGGC